MPKKIIWSYKALKDLESIIEYWNNRNKSKVYGRKLHLLIQDTFALIAVQPLIGLVTDMKDVRIKMVRDYWIFYKIGNDSIFVLQIMSTYQNPETYFRSI